MKTNLIQTAVAALTLAAAGYPFATRNPQTSIRPRAARCVAWPAERQISGEPRRRNSEYRENYFGVRGAPIYLV
jgi:hypothetical protein